MLVALADPSWSPLPISEVVVCVAVVRPQSLAGIHKKGRRIYNKIVLMCLGETGDNCNTPQL